MATQSAAGAITGQLKKYGAPVGMVALTWALARFAIAPSWQACAISVERTDPRTIIVRNDGKVLDGIRIELHAAHTAQAIARLSEHTNMPSLDKSVGSHGDDFCFGQEHLSTGQEVRIELRPMAKRSIGAWNLRLTADGVDLTDDWIRFAKWLRWAAGALAGLLAIGLVKIMGRTWWKRRQRRKRPAAIDLKHSCEFAKTSQAQRDLVIAEFSRYLRVWTDLNLSASNATASDRVTVLGSRRMLEIGTTGDFTLREAVEEAAIWAMQNKEPDSEDEA